MVKALDTTAGYATRWTYTSPRQAATVRLVAGGHVYVADGSGELVVLEEQTGKRVWSYRLSAEPHPMENVVAESDWRGYRVGARNGAGEGVRAGAGRISDRVRRRLT
ncbi:outer membrane protein assembly factor BamB family protein [Streptomyces sp. CB02261]|uniref:outer membrane protein assembly factor BamB family protein n=1 Tax=Streptomyces sp. CB02261 TaxID=1703940 RepID=UPI00095D9A68|nr:hypothetical protein AMK29_19540 [Streptomyces sp. CB02261]